MSHFQFTLSFPKDGSSLVEKLSRSNRHRPRSTPPLIPNAASSSHARNLISNSHFSYQENSMPFNIGGVSPPAKKTLRHVLSKSFGLNGEQNGTSGKKYGDDDLDEECLIISGSGPPCDDAEDKNAEASGSQCRPKRQQKILPNISGFSDDEFDHGSEKTGATRSNALDSRRRRPKRRAVSPTDAETESTVYWGLRSTYYQPDFEIERDDRTIVPSTALSPPPFHRDRRRAESFLLL